MSEEKKVDMNGFPIALPYPDEDYSALLGPHATAQRY
jgi:hypothetical protein